MNIRNPETRRYLYGVVLALIPVLVVFGLVSPDDVATWTNLAGALLGLGAAGLALPNTPAGGPDYQGEAGAAPGDVLTVPPATPGPDVYEGRHVREGEVVAVPDPVDPVEGEDPVDPARRPGM